MDLLWNIPMLYYTADILWYHVLTKYTENTAPVTLSEAVEGRQETEDSSVLSYTAAHS